MTITMAQDETFWAAFMARDAKADGSFVVAVKTTGIYCRPSCPAKKPLRKNVEFFALTADARNAGYRACKRCRPDEISTHQRDALSVEEACRTLEAADSAPTLAVLADQAGLSAHHFHRIFKAHTGLTPKAYHQAARARRTADALGSEGTVTAAAFAGGFQSLSRFYDAVALRFGMTPSSIAAGGRGEVLVLAQAKAPLGVVTAAFSRRGVTSIVLTDREEDGAEETKKRFQHAMFLDGGAEFEALMAEVVAATVEPVRAEELPLDIRG
ncbi:MAG: Ada metal-binding domain-containing protein, partial [Pseudomonadota bacterium]